MIMGEIKEANSILKASLYVNFIVNSHRLFFFPFCYDFLCDVSPIIQNFIKKKKKKKTTSIYTYER